MRRTTIFGAILSILLIAAVLFGTSYAGRSLMFRVDDRVEDQKEALATAMRESIVRHDSAVAAVGSNFEGVPNLTAAEGSALRRYLNAEHLEKAREFGVGRVTGARQINRYLAQGRLVSLIDSPYYYLKDLTVSVPYVTPDTKQLLDKIGERFHAELKERGLPLYRFAISSVLRTELSQAQLRRINPNAARGVSTHEFGTTLDLVYHSFDYLPTENDRLPQTEYELINDRIEDLLVQSYTELGERHHQELKGILGRELLQLQKEGDVVVIYERRQPVYHITISREYES